MLPMIGKIESGLKEMIKPRMRIWAVFAVIFGISQAINLWAIFPAYTGWNIFGFPFIYIQFQPGAGYVYFNLVFFLIDLAFWYVVAKAIIFGHSQLTKFKVMKQSK